MDFESAAKKYDQAALSDAAEDMIADDFWSPTVEAPEGLDPQQKAKWAQVMSSMMRGDGTLQASAKNYQTTADPAMSIAQARLMGGRGAPTTHVGHQNTSGSWTKGVGKWLDPGGVLG